MEMTSVQSSQIESVGYDHSTRALDVKFKSGGLYRYHEVSAETYRAFVSSASLGKYLAAHIKGKYAFERLGA